MCDNAVIVKGIRKGPHYQHKVNRHVWKLFWHVVGQRRVHPVKIKSHRTEDAALEACYSQQGWSANKEADRLADEAAQEAQPCPEDVEAVRWADDMAFLVQQHLLAVG